VRRIVSITLLLLVSLPLISPLFAANTAGSILPACCRRDGKHHCAMPEIMWNSSSRETDHHLSALRERCSHYPTAVQASTLQFLSLHCNTAAISVVPDNIALRVAQEKARYRISFDRSRQKRGPPSISPALS
jgi:hypothetical protein